MPANMITALVASSPNVAGSRMLMPASGPIPGSTPTSVPTKHPRNAYHSTSGRNATEKPSNRLSNVPSTLEPDQPALERRLQQDREQRIDRDADAGAVHYGEQRFPAFEQRQAGEHRRMPSAIMRTQISLGHMPAPGNDRLPNGRSPEIANISTPMMIAAPP